MPAEFPSHGHAPSQFRTTFKSQVVRRQPESLACDTVTHPVTVARDSEAAEAAVDSVRARRTQRGRPGPAQAQSLPVRPPLDLLSQSPSHAEVTARVSPVTLS